MIFLLCSRRTFLGTGYHTRMVQELLRYPVGDDHDLQIGAESGQQMRPQPSRCDGPRIESFTALTVLCRSG
jgi:hypothetical protein